MHVRTHDYMVFILDSFISLFLYSHITHSINAAYSVGSRMTKAPLLPTKCNDFFILKGRINLQFSASDANFSLRIVTFTTIEEKFLYRVSHGKMSFF